jgi:imidazolonepropionase-like amidohydrolase
MGQGYYPGHTKETLKDHLYFTIDSEADLEKKWPLILRLRPDSIKTNLWCSDEFEKRKNDPAYSGRKGLDPHLLPKIVAKAHAANLRVSAHITNAADFHHAVAAGVDELAHSVAFGYFKTLEERFQEFISGRDPRGFADLITDGIRSSNQSNPSYIPISAEDARLAARRGTVVITTVALMMRSPEAVRAAFTPVQTANLKLLREHGVALAIGSDNVIDSSVLEFEYLARLGIFDNLTLLKMWTETTPRMIFPKRQIGALAEGYEASFLALEGNPLEDLRSRIKVRFKQGVALEP